jgi:tetratricopeptide (TPR) repeat protein
VLWLLSSQALPAQATLELALALRAHWESAGLPASLQSVLEQALAILPAHAELQGLRCDAHEMLAYQRFEAGFSAEALAHADTAVQLAGDQASRRARALVRRAWIDLAAGRTVDDDSPATQRLLGWLHEALALAQRAQDREAQARALHQLAVVASHLQDDWVGAEALLAQSQALWAALGDRRKASARLRNRAQCWAQLGRTDDALACFERCETQARDDADWVGQIDSLLSRSTLLASRRHWQAALQADRQCVALCWQRWHRHGLAYALWNPPRSLARLRRPEPAMRLMAFAATFWESSFGPLARSDRQTVRRVRRLVQAQVGTAQAEAWWAEGTAMDIGSAVALALQA